MSIEELIFDARMFNASGIGRYIHNVAPIVFKNLSSLKIKINGYDISTCERLLENSNVEFTKVGSRIYSPFEQLEYILAGSNSKTLFWSPHYNFPLFIRGKRLVTIHDLCHLTMRRYFGGAKRIYASTMFNAAARLNTNIICVSNATRKTFQQITSCPDSKIKVIQNGFDPIPTKEMAHPFKECLPYFLFVGNVKPHKNLVGLIKAFANVLNEIPHKLVLVGNRENFITSDPVSQEMANALGNQVKFTGFIKDEELWEYYANATALVLPSFCEGFGLPLLEAMSARCPVLCSDIEVFREVCGDAAVFFDPYLISDISAKIQLLAKSERKRENLIAKGIRQIKKYSWGKCASETLAYIETIL